MAIRRFSSCALKRFFERGDVSRIAAEHRHQVRDILARLNAASRPDDMDLPGLRLHTLDGRLSGHWSATVRANWRVTFRFEGEDAVDVDYLDYH